MNNTETKFVIFTDGSSRGNPGPGGWGAVVVEQKLVVGMSDADEKSSTHVTELGGGEKHTTNNRMELTAAFEGLNRASKNSSVTVCTDSSYVINGITKWVHGWKKNNWQTKAKQDVLNKDLWVKLDACIQDKKIEWKYVGGHIGIAGNERCDVIATSYADGVDITLYDGLLSSYVVRNILDVSHNVDKLVKKKSNSSKSNAKAFSYVSMVGGIVQTHSTWAECEKRVKGMKGARFKKSYSKQDEEVIKKDFIKS